MQPRAWWRPLGVVVLILVWLSIAGAGGSTFGKLSAVQSNAAADFLPQSAESTRAALAYAQFAPESTVPGLFVVEDLPGAGGVAQVQEFADAVAASPIEGDPAGRTVGQVLAQAPVVIPSEDGQAAMVIFDVDAAAASERVGEESLAAAVAHTITQTWEDVAGDTDGNLTGPLGFITDLVAAFAGIDGLLLLVALTVVLVILLIVYRSPVLPLLVLTTAMIALTGAIIAVYAMAKSEWITLNGQTQGIMFILVVGATTDYSLLLVARYREELRRIESPYEAMRRAWRQSLEPITASAATVIAALLVLLMSDLRSLQAIGPAGAVGIVASVAAALTLLPALLLIGGNRARGVFWPRRPLFEGSEGDDSLAAVEARAGLWGRVSRRVSSGPRTVWLAAAAVLLVLAAFAPTLKIGGVGERDYFLGDVASVRGLDALERHFSGGATSPIRIVVPQEEADAAAAAAAEVPGVESAEVLTTFDDGPVVIDGQVVVVVVTSAAASSAEAVDVVADVRDAVHPVAPHALVGGQAAEALDTRLTTLSDARTIIPLVLIVILVVLIMLLRAVVAPLIIVGANIVSFGSALGLSALVFNTVFDFPGTDPTTPLLAFVFLVALGVDYSIFLMSRAREEALGHGNRAGVRRALATTGGVITSAGIVLAATFAALAVIPLLFLAQIAFIVAVGVLIDTFIVRSLLVPGAVMDVGRRSWWPWHSRIDP